jgi:hypothetical protein
MNTKTRTVEDLLRDAAYAMRLARQISMQIREEATERAQPKRPLLTDAAPPVTLGA